MDREQSRVEILREYVAIASAGISIGAALMIVMPVDVMRVAGLENANQMVAIKITFLAALVSIIARWTRITIRRK